MTLAYNWHPNPRTSGAQTHERNHKELVPAAKAYNRSHVHKRAPGERSFATLKTWRILGKARCTVAKIGKFAQAILALRRGASTNIRL